MLETILNIFSAKKRKNRIQILAENIGFSLSAEWDYSLDHDLQDFTFSEMDKTRSASYNVLSAVRDGARWKIFDRNGSRLGGLRPIFRFQTMIFVELADVALGNPGYLGHYFITPKSAIGSLCMKFKRKKAGDARVYHVRDTPTGSFFVVAESKSDLEGIPKGLWDALGRDKKKRYSVEVLRKSALFYRVNKVISARDIPAFFNDVLQFVNFFKGRTAA